MYIISNPYSDVQTVMNINVHQNQIHVLDTGLSASVTNTIDVIQQDILNQLGLQGDVKDYEWFLYGQDGVVSHYVSGFNFLRLDDPRLDPDLVALMPGRKEMWRSISSKMGYFIR